MMIVCVIRSLDGILDKLHSDRLVEGISLDTLPVLTDLNKSTHSGRKENNKYLPGSHSSKLNDGSRSTRPELVTSSIRFSATGVFFLHMKCVLGLSNMMYCRSRVGSCDNSRSPNLCT